MRPRAILIRAVAIPGILFAVLTPVRSQQSIDWEEVHRTTVRGIDHLYSLRFGPALATFDSTIRMAPNDPRGWFFKSMVHFYVFQLTQAETAYTRFFALSESVIEKAERLVDNDPGDLNARFYLGGIYGYRGLAYQRKGNVLSALWDGRKGYGQLREAATGPTYSVDAKMGFGLFTYLVGKIPRSFSWMLSILGFSGDVEQGLEMIRAAADSGTYTRTEAAFYYAQFCFFERRYDEAYRYMRAIMDRYPDNSLFLVTFAAWELRQDRIDEAIRIAEQAIEVNDRNAVRTGDEFAHSTLAAAYFVRNDLRAAIRHWYRYESLLDDPQNVSNFVLYRLGLAHELLGDRPLAVATWRRMKKSTDEDRPWESVYWRRAQVHLTGPLTEAERLLIIGRNLQQAGRGEEAAGLFAIAAGLAGTDRDLSAMALYDRLSALQDCGDQKSVGDLATRILQLNPRREVWVVPHALYRLGLASIRLGRPAEAEQAFRQALSFRSYDWEVSLRERLESQIEKLRKAES